MRFQISARHTDLGLFKTTHHPQQQSHLPTGAFIRAIAEPETHKQNTDFPRTFPAWLELKVNTFRALQKNGFQSVYKLYIVYLVGLWDITVRRLNLENMYNVSKIVIYQSYVRNKRDHNDIALIRLNRPAKLGKNVQPICLPPTVKIHTLINCISPLFSCNNTLKIKFFWKILWMHACVKKVFGTLS